MQVGQLAGPRDRFCPVGAVTKWPYRHLYDKEESEKVSIKYFAAGQFRSRGWTMYVTRCFFTTSFFRPEYLSSSISSSVGYITLPSVHKLRLTLCASRVTLLRVMFLLNTTQLTHHVATMFKHCWMTPSLFYSFHVRKCWTSLEISTITSRYLPNFQT